MKLCRKQKAIIYIIIIISVIVSSYVAPSPWIPLVVAIVEFLVMKILEKLFKEPTLDEGKLARAIAIESKKVKDRHDFLEKLNDVVFRKWKNVSIYSDNFHINEIKIKEKIDSDLLSQGKEFLKSRNDETRKILDIWNKLELSKNKYNEIGKRVRSKIEERLSKAYPSLKGLESRRVGATSVCYVRNNIIGFIEYSLKPIFLENGKVDWEKILHIEPYKDTFRLEDNEQCDVFIQSKNKTDVDIIKFGNVMEKLKLNVLDDLKQLTDLHNNIEGKLEDFKGKMNRLSNRIDLSLISG